MRFDQGAGEGRGYGREGQSEVEQASKTVVRDGKRSRFGKSKGTLIVEFFLLGMFRLCR